LQRLEAERGEIARERELKIYELKPEMVRSSPRLGRSNITKSGVAEVDLLVLESFHAFAFQD
jgi:hypothetical protein